MTEYFNVPILLLVFNRPSKTKKVFDVIKKIKPKVLYIAADGPRLFIKNDIINCEQVRNIIKDIDWDCNLYLKFSDLNLGVYENCVQGINWLFNNEEVGIVIEDDCLPDLSFFPYCEELLNKYKYDENIMLISGSNLGFNVSDDSYYFSKYGQIWGWASWKRSWSKFQKNVDINNQKIVFNSVKEKNYWTRNFKNIQWDVQFAVYSIWLNDGLSILPARNLISNIGFDIDATNYKLDNNINANIMMQEMSFPLKHPKIIKHDTVLDYKIFMNSYYKSFTRRIIDKIKLFHLKFLNYANKK